MIWLKGKCKLLAPPGVNALRGRQGQGLGRGCKHSCAQSCKQTGDRQEEEAMVTEDRGQTAGKAACVYQSVKKLLPNNSSSNNNNNDDNNKYNKANDEHTSADMLQSITSGCECTRRRKLPVNEANVGKHCDTHIRTQTQAHKHARTQRPVRTCSWEEGNCKARRRFVHFPCCFCLKWFFAMAAAAFSLAPAALWNITSHTRRNNIFFLVFLGRLSRARCQRRLLWVLP